MGKEKKTKDYKRARTISQKAERREAILRAATDLLRSSGLESFSMGGLAKTVGIARGTLYLYFETREDVLLTVYAQQLDIWNDTLVASVYAGMDDAAFLKAFWPYSVKMLCF